MIMVSVIEKEYMETVIRMGKRMNSGEIDWEQRRYEIAKDVCSYSLVLTLSTPLEQRATYEELAEAAVKMAGTLVEELKKNPVKK